MQNNLKLPLLPNHAYPEQINVKVDAETKRDVHILKSEGIDTAELFRISLRETIAKAKLLLKASAAKQHSSVSADKVAI